MAADTVLTASLKDEISRGVAAIKENLSGLGEVAQTAFSFALGGIVQKGIEGIGGTLLDSASDVAAFSSDAAQAQRDLQAQLGLTEDQAGRLGDVSERVFANNWGNDIADVTEAVKNVREQVGELNDADTQKLTESALAIRDSFGAETPDSLQAISVLMEKFGLNAEQATDFVTAGFQKGLNTSGDFLESITEYGVQFAESKATAAQFFSALETGNQAGVLGTDKIADAFKESRIRITEMSDDVVDAYKEIGNQSFGKNLAAQFGEQGDLLINTKEKAQAVLDTFKSLGIESSTSIEDLTRPLTIVDEKTGAITTQAQDFGSVFMSEILNGIEQGSLTVADAQNLALEGLRGMDNQISQNSAGVKIFGTQWEDLGADALLAVDTAKTSMDDLAGATDSLNVKYANWPSLWEGARRSALVGLQPIGDKLLEIANDNMPTIQAAISWLATGLPPIIDQAVAGIEVFQTSIQPWLPIIGSVVAALGTLAVLTTVAGWVGALAGAFATAGGGIAGMLAIAGPLAPFLTALTGPIGIVAAAVGLLGLAWSTNFGDIQGKTATAWAFLQPILAMVGDWLGVKLVAAGNALAGFWTNTLQPAFATVGSFLNGTVFPILGALASVWLALVKKEFELASALITNVVIPALKAVGEWINDKVTPFVSDLADKIKDDAGPALKTFKEVLEGVKTWLGYISDSIGTVIDWFKRLAEAIDKIEIPSWLQGQSPPPLADWLEYIADSTDRAVNSIGYLNEALKDGDIEKYSKAFKDISESLQSSQISGAVSMASEQLQALKDVAGLRDRDAIKKNQQSITEAEQELAKLRTGVQTEDTIKKQEELIAKLGELRSEQTLLNENNGMADFVEQQLQQLQDSLAQLAETNPEAAAKIYQQQREAIVQQAELQNDLRRALAEGNYDEARDIQKQIDATAELAKVERIKLEEEIQKEAEKRASQLHDLLNQIGADVTPEMAAFLQTLSDIFQSATESLATVLQNVGTGFQFGTGGASEATTNAFGRMASSSNEPASSTTTTERVVLQVNINNPGAGVDEQLIRRWAREGAQEAIQDYDDMVSRRRERNFR